MTDSSPTEDWCKVNNSKSLDGHRRAPATNNLLNTKLKTVSSRSVDSASSKSTNHSNDDSNLQRKLSGYHQKQNSNNVRTPQRRETGPLIGKHHAAAYYENIEIDYINQLTQEGYQKETVVKALSISRNDIELAREILREFASRTTSRAK